MKRAALTSRLLLLSLAFALPPAFAGSDADLQKKFGVRDACLAIADLRTGKTVLEYNAKRCRERFSPCSSFKVAAALMAFEQGILKDENQVIRWDGVERDRRELNHDQTPMSWMSHSAKWVTEWLMPQFGASTIQKFLATFAYGNQDFSGGWKDAWVMSSLKISAREQLAFFRRWWRGELTASRVFAANASDRVAQKSPAGPRLRDTTIEILEAQGLLAER